MKKKLFISVVLLAILSMSLNATVYATVAGEDLVDRDIEAVMKTMKGAKFKDLSDVWKQIFVEKAIERKLLTVEATKSGIEKDKEYLEALTRIKSDLTLEDLTRIKGDLAFEMWLKKIYDGVKVDVKDVKDYYDKTPDIAIAVKGKHVLLKTEQEAKEVIKEVENLNGQKLADKFTELVTINARQGGGDTGWFTANQMAKPFEDAAFALKKGEMTKAPVKTHLGFYVILVEDKKEIKKESFDTSKTQIENNLKMEKFRAIVTDKAKKLRENAKITINEENYNTKALQPAPIKY